MKPITRRDCLRTSALLGGSMFLPKLALGKSGPSAISKLNVALIGSGGIAETAFGECKHENVIAIAEVDEIQGAPGFKSFPAAQKFKVQTVMGNQGHNFDGMRMIREWYEAGLISKVREVHAWTGRTTTNHSNAKIKLSAEPVSATLDWDLWTGPAVLTGYHKKLCPAGWRWWWDYGLGGLGDIGCHTFDIPVYALGLGYPTAVYMDISRKTWRSKTPR